MSSWTRTSSTGATEDQARSAEPRRNRIGIGKIIVLSLGVGLAAAVLLPFIPWPTVDANFATAMVLFGFAVGWALLAALSVRLTDQPQKWAYAPAVFMGVGAVLLLFLPDAVLDALDWVWPPALLVLVVWVYRHAKRDLRSRTRHGCSTRCWRCSCCSRWVARTRPSVARWNRASPCAANSSMSGHTASTWSAPARAPRPSSLSPAAGRRRRPSVGSRPTWPAIPRYASTTEQERDGVTPRRRHPTARRPRPTSTRCSSGRMSPAPTCWPGTPSAACT